MTKPLELVEAELVYNMCQEFQTLPDAGGVLDQDVAVLRLRSILVAGGYFEARSGTPTQPRDVFAGIEIVTL